MANILLTTVGIGAASGEVGTEIDYKTIIQGHKLSGATLANDTVVQVFSADEAGALAGKGSLLHVRARRWFRKNRKSKVFLSSVAEPAGTAKSVTVQISGTATEGGILPIYIGDDRVPVAVAAGDVNTDVATALNDDVTNLQDTLPMQSGVVTDTVTLTVRWVGESGNGVTVEAARLPTDKIPAGLTVVIAPGDAGAGAPDLTGFFGALGPTWYQFLDHPWRDPTLIAAMELVLEARADEFSQTPMIACGGIDGDVAAQQAAAIGNSKYIQWYGQPGPDHRTPTYEISTAALSVGVPLINANANAGIAGQVVEVTPAATPFTPQQSITLAGSGLSPLVSNSAGNVAIYAANTSYLTNGLGAADTTFQTLQTMTILNQLRFSFRVEWNDLYGPKEGRAGANIVADVALVEPQPGIINVDLAKAVEFAEAWATRRITAGLMQNLAAFRESLIVTQPGSQELKFELPVDVVQQLLRTDATILVR